MKYIVLMPIFVLCCAGAVLVRSYRSEDFTVHSAVSLDSAERLRQGVFEGTFLDSIDISGSWICFVAPDSSEQGEHYYTTSLVPSEFPFNEAVFSWNRLPDGRGPLLVQVRAARTVEEVTSWYELAFMDRPEGYWTKRLKRDERGHIDEDFLVLRDYHDYIQLRFKLLPGSSVGNIHVVLTDSRANLFTKMKFSPKTEGEIETVVNLDVPYLSQLDLPDSVAQRACSPTAAAMVLNYLGVDVRLEDFIWEVYDPENDIFGNWPYNIDAIAGYGFRAHIMRHGSFDEIAPDLLSGYPVVISMAFDKGELRGSPIKGGSDGHLVVVRGFDEDGDVIVNDPAGHSPDDGVITYDRDELEKAWTGHYGVAYHVESFAD